MLHPQVQGKGVKLSNHAAALQRSEDDTSAAHAAAAAAGRPQPSRIHIGADMVAIEVEQERRESDRLPGLFLAARAEMTLTLHWRCLGRPEAHHYCQMLGPSPPFGPRSYPHAPPCPSPTPDGPAGWDTFWSFRSTALALTARISAHQTQTVLRIGSVRWLARFMASWEREADPVRRFNGALGLDPSSLCTLLPVPKSSFSQHVKAVQVRSLSLSRSRSRAHWERPPPDRAH